MYLIFFYLLEECMFGDDPGTFRYEFKIMTCKGGYYTVQNSPHLCYIGDIRRRCCDTCSSVHTGFLGKYLVNFIILFIKLWGEPCTTVNTLFRLF